jgi:hypothetical protein
MESILKTIYLEPMDITYLGIGSSPHLTTGGTLEAKRDQLIPVCFHETILNDKKSMRILHFDPHFDQDLPFLYHYFEQWGLLPMEVTGGYSWLNESLEVIVIASNLDHEKDSWFVESLCDTILTTKGKLIIQEYTGYELKELNQRLYEACPQKETFKRRILVDMTFGTDLGCSTDMTKVQPFYESNGDFLNLHFLTDVDAKRYVGVSQRLDEVLLQKYRGLFYQTLNRMHVDYRRKLKGDTLLYGDPQYTEESSPEVIMSVLQETLHRILTLLAALRVISKERVDALTPVFINYKTYDPYKWYDIVYKTVP